MSLVCGKRGSSSLSVETKSDMFGSTIVRHQDTKKQVLLSGPPGKVLKVKADETRTILADEQDTCLAPPQPPAGALTLFARDVQTIIVDTQGGCPINLNITSCGTLVVKGDSHVMIDAKASQKPKEKEEKQPAQPTYLINSMDITGQATVSIEDATVDRVSVFEKSHLSIKSNAPVGHLGIFNQGGEAELADGCARRAQSAYEPNFTSRAPPRKGRKQRLPCEEKDCKAFCSNRDCGGFCSASWGGLHFCSLCYDLLEVAFVKSQSTPPV